MTVQRRTPRTKNTLVKAVHIKIERVHQTTTRSCIKHLYMTKAMVFPLGFKMQLVQLSAKIQPKAKASNLHSNQARFLMQKETCSMWEFATLKLHDHQRRVTLTQLIMNILDPLQPTCQLFHAVNKMFIHNGYIF